MSRKRLRRRELFALGTILRHAAFLDRPYRLAGIAIEHEYKSLLGRLNDDVARTVAGIDPRQRRLRRQVIVPDVMMHGLERPHQFTGFATQCDHRIGMLIIARTLAAPEIRTGRGCRQEHQPACFIRRHRRPDIGGAGIDAIMRKRIPAPARLSAACIKGAHRAGRRIDADIVRNRRADNDDAAAHHRRRGDLKLARPDQGLADIEPHLAIAAEAGAGDAGPGIERDHAGIVGAHEYPGAAGGICCRLFVDPMGNAAAVIAISGPLRGADLRIVSPLLGPGAGIKRDYLVEGCAEHEAVFDQ